MEGAKREDGSLITDGPSSGVVARAVRRIFAALDASGAEWHVKISFLEIYNEKLDDLLTAVSRRAVVEPAGSCALAAMPNKSDYMQI